MDFRTELKASLRGNCCDTVKVDLVFILMLLVPQT